ncbi:hypothetical protein Lser_V15G35386 [Lactuca serriola]
MYVYTTLINMNTNNMLLLCLYSIMLVDYAYVFADTDIDGYHIVNHDDLPLPPVDPLTPVLPEAYCSSPPGFSPPSSTTLPPAIGSYTPSPPATSSSSYHTPPFSFSTPPTTTSTPGSPATYQPTPSGSSNPPATYQPTPSGSSNPPATYEPTPSGSYNNPPSGSNEPSPPTFTFPSPTGFIPAPPLFEPPIVYPPPTRSPPAHSSPESALWCVAKPSVPDPIIQEAMNYACGSGADCESLQPNGECFQPDTLFAHASYAFNSYWQRTKVAGGTCEFGGSAMLVTADPSYDGCHFIYF